MIPAFDKYSIPNLCAVIGCVLFAPRQQRRRRRVGLPELLMAAYVLGPVFSSVSNSDTLVYGDRILPGAGYYDGISALVTQSLLFLPFIIGRRYLQERSSIETILRALVVGGLFYSIPMWFEIRMSPQLSKWIFGVFPSSFAGETRYDGFRPVVFMENGLVLAFFLATAFLAAIALWRAKVRLLPPAGIPAYLGVVVVFCKSAGALTYSFIFGIIVRWTSPKLQIRLAVLMVSVALIYPVLRLTDQFPDQPILDTASFFSRERADSLGFRFEQEKQLIAYTSQRLIFGWGRYGRNRIYDESGKDTSITDGAWILTLGQFGLVGFIAQFGLLALPVFRAMVAVRSAESKRESILLAALALIVALGVIEQIPNASISSWSWLLAGALLGRSEQLVSRARRTTQLTFKIQNVVTRPAEQ